MGHLLQVFQDGVNSVTAERWRDACGKAEKIEKFYWERDQLTDRIIEQFVINLEVESDDDLDEEKGEDKDNVIGLWIRYLQWPYYSAYYAWIEASAGTTL